MTLKSVSNSSLLSWHICGLHSMCIAYNHDRFAHNHCYYYYYYYNIRLTTFFQDNLGKLAPER